MNCQNCKSERILNISAKCADRCSFSLGGLEKDNGYVPKDMGIGGDDYAKFMACLDCGQIQGIWPRPETAFEAEIIAIKNDPYHEDDFVEFEQNGHTFVGSIIFYERKSGLASIFVEGTWDFSQKKLLQNASNLLKSYRARYAQNQVQIFLAADQIKKTDKEW